MVGGKDQDIPIGGRGLLDGDHIVPLPPLAVCIGLQGDTVSHLFKPLLQVLHRRRFPLGANGPVAGSQRFQIRLDAGHIGQFMGPLQHQQRLGHRNGAPRRQAFFPAVHDLCLDAPEHRSPGPLRHGRGVLVPVEALGRHGGRLGPPPQDRSKLLAGDRAVRLIGPLPYPQQIALVRRPGDGTAVSPGYVGKRALLGNTRPACRLIEQLGRHPAGDILCRRIQKFSADGHFLPPAQGLPGPIGPRRRRSGHCRRYQGQTKQQRTDPFHKTTSSSQPVSACFFHTEYRRIPPAKSFPCPPVSSFPHCQRLFDQAGQSSRPTAALAKQWACFDLPVQSLALM